MGDRCYMQVTCKRKDRSVFEALGFTSEGESDEFPDCLEMVDPEANYGHADDLPTDLVYLGSHDAGGTYGPADLACDGETYLEQRTDGAGGFVVIFDHEGNPDAASLANVKTFITNQNNVRIMLAKRRLGKRCHARLAEAPNFSPAKEK